MKPDLLVQDFLKVASLAGVQVGEIEISLSRTDTSHEPPKRLPAGKMAVYVFTFNGMVLKVGKAGPKSSARFTSHHYNPASAPSTLAASILKNPQVLGVTGLSDENVGSWLKNNTSRTNFILDAKCGIQALTLLEIFLQCRLKPRFEGFASQQ